MHVNYDMHLFWFNKESEGSVTLYYELYIDSLFLMDFAVNLCILLLTKRLRTYSTTGLRCVAGAAYGGALHCIIFLVPVLSLSVKLVLGYILAVSGMICITFKCKSVGRFVKVLSQTAGTMFFIGGFYFFVSNSIFLGKSTPGEGIGTYLILLTAYFLGTFIVKKVRKNNDFMCNVSLYGEECVINVKALIDTGNSLVEPVSKKPVSILDMNTLEKLFGGNLPEYYRIVPFTSVGKKKGILKCFEIAKISIKYQDDEEVYEKVLVACSEEIGAKEGYMILNPKLINKQEECKYDI